MSRKAENICIGGLVLQTLCALGCFLLAPITNSHAVFAEAWHFALGIGIWLVCLLHVYFRRMAIEERLDEEAMRRRGGGERGEGIFGPEGAADAFSAQARLERVEKWLVPIGSLLFGLGMVVVAVLMATGWGRPVDRVENALAGIGTLAGIVFLTFLMARFAVGQSQEEDSALLRGPGSYMLFNTLCSLAIAITLALAYFGSLGLERVLAWIIIAALGLIGVELVLTFVINLYRPRRTGREARAPYDSRLLSLLSMPKRILKSAAETLDYQFGFKVSETWFFRFLERALAPLILFGLITLYLLSCFLVVPSGHLAFIERFGKPRAEADEAARGEPKIYHAGLHMKWPWPFETSRVVEATRVQEFTLGVSGKEVGREEYEKALARGEKAQMPPVVWTSPHFAEEYNLLVGSRESGGETDAGTPESPQGATPDAPDTAPEAGVEAPETGVEAPEAGDGTSETASEAPEAGGEVEKKGPPVNLLTVSVPVQFVVRESKLYEYTYNYVDVAKALEAVAYRELVLYVAGADLDSILGPGRAEAGDALQERIQAAADRADLGVDVIFVGLHGVHPPFAVSSTFEAAVTALENREAHRLGAIRTAAEKSQQALGQKATIINAAQAKRFTTRMTALGDATRFEAFNYADTQASRIFRLRHHLDMLERVLPRKKLVIAPGGEEGQEVVIINLEEKPERKYLEQFTREAKPAQGESD